MAKVASTREQWTLPFDAELKAFLVRLAKRRHFRRVEGLTLFAGS